MGVEMAAHAVGPDHHDGADRIARRLLDARLREISTPRRADAGLDLRRRSPRRHRPNCRRGRRPARHWSPAASRAAPGGDLRLGGTLAGVVLEAGEEGAPAVVDRHSGRPRSGRGVPRCRERWRRRGTTSPLKPHSRPGVPWSPFRERRPLAPVSSRAARAALASGCPGINDLFRAPPHPFKSLDERAAEPRRRWRNMDSRHFHGLDLVFRAAPSALQ